MNLLLIIAIISLLFVSQILRVKLLNYLVRPHYSIGLRSGLFMNSICSFLNIITPFRLGEIYRFRFLSVRYNSPKSISLIAIILERFIDSITLISGLVMFTKSSIFEIGTIQIYFILFVVIAVTAVAFSPKKYRQNSSIIQWNRQLSHLQRNATSSLLVVSFGIWFTYLLAGYLVCRLFATELSSWFAWNTSGYRLLDLDVETNRVSQHFNVLFIFSFLLIGFVASLMGHRYNRLTTILNVTWPDTSYPTKLLNRNSNHVKRTFFLESPMVTYWRKTLRDGKVEAVYSGGSGALVFSLTTELKTLRKVGFGFQKYRLQEQFDYMHQHSALWNFPKVRNPQLTQMYFSFDMDLVEDSLPFYSHLSDIREPGQLKVEIDRLYSFIEDGNSVHRRISKGEYSGSIERLWDGKLRLIVEELYLRVPYLDTGAEFSINGSELKNLMSVFNSLRKLALSVDPILIETNPHGDPSLSNLLVSKENKKILSIDPNPNQMIRNSSIDHGKVLQSLLLLYEDSLRIQVKPSLSRNDIVYSRASNHSIALAGEYYFQVLSKDELLAINAELMCFASMLRLLPYRLNQDSDYSPIFLAQAIEYGNSLVEKYVK